MNKIQLEMSRIVEMEETFMRMRKKEKQKVCENLKVHDWESSNVILCYQ